MSQWRETLRYTWGFHALLRRAVIESALAKNLYLQYFGETDEQQTPIRTRQDDIRALEAFEATLARRSCEANVGNGDACRGSEGQSPSQGEEVSPA